ncbi:hypothetical protein ACRAWD_31140 [Caulobacter segnis]
MRQVNRQGGVDREIEIALNPGPPGRPGRHRPRPSSQALVVVQRRRCPGGRVTIVGLASATLRTLGAAGSVEQLRADPRAPGLGGAVRPGRPGPGRPTTGPNPARAPAMTARRS